jgi:hypothetical protein
MIITVYELYQAGRTQNISIGKFRIISNFKYTRKYSKQTEEEAALSMATVAHVVSALQVRYGAGGQERLPRCRRLTALEQVEGEGTEVLALVGIGIFGCDRDLLDRGNARRHGSAWRGCGKWAEAKTERTRSWHRVATEPLRPAGHDHRHTPSRNLDPRNR